MLLCLSSGYVAPAMAKLSFQIQHQWGNSISCAMLILHMPFVPNSCTIISVI